MSTTIVGISGAKRNACVATAIDGQIRAACEQERLTRIRAVGLVPRRLPTEAVNEVLALAERKQQDVTAYVIAEPNVQLPAGLPTLSVDHHHAHAAASFLTSSVDRAAVLVCDSSSDRELSVWSGNGTLLKDEQWSWPHAFATLYSNCAELFRFERGQEHRLEALAHLSRGERAGELRHVFRYVDGTLQVDDGWRTHIDRMIQGDDRRNGQAIDAASAVQGRIGELLLELVADIRRRSGHSTLCLGGGLFYNTYFTTLIRMSGLFDHVFVPINPGNAGLAIGAALMAAARDGHTRAPHGVSPFLGPVYDSDAIKTELDGCKLSYAFLNETEIIDSTVDALARGQLVGWFQGRMEWGHRSLGHRSILADPRSSYVLDNLNSFLRKRERWRAFGVSVCEDDVAGHFCGPPSSPWMEYEFIPRDPERLRHVMPPGASSIRVQTVTPGSRMFWALHKRMGQATGQGVLVNTSFNGFQEPIVCSPRDAVRVFYGTGLDMLVLGRFVLRK
jgi:carbamoyltransferase